VLGAGTNWRCCPRSSNVYRFLTLRERIVATRAGTTIVELTLTMVLVGIMSAIGLPRARSALDRLSVRGAKQDVAFALAAARGAAIRRGDYAAFSVDPRGGHVRVLLAGETVIDRELITRRGVSITASRESVTFAPSGLGYGAANTTIVLRRGGAADTIVTSRLGRVRD
jgi:Tfp pilus assembly protein FimT